MSTEIAAAYVSIGARVAGLEAGLLGASKKIDAFAAKADRSAARSSSALSSIGRAAKIGGAGVAFGLGYAVKTAADFEKTMSTLKVVSQASGAQMGKLRAQALALGQSSIFSSRQVASAQVELGKAGVSTAEILGGALRASLSLAAAGGLDLASAAKIAANTMNNFGLRAKSARSIADQLATAANQTTGDVADFGQALENVGSTARVAGIGFKDTNVALMALAKNGTIGAEAGTNLRSALTNIATPSAKASGLMRKLGLDFYDSQGRFKKMVDVSDMLRRSFARLTPEQRQNAAAVIAGSYGQKALLALYAAGPERLKLYQDQLGRTGTAARVAAGMQDNLRGKWEQFTGAIETGSIKLGSALIPALTSATVATTGFLTKISGSAGFASFSDALGSSLAAGFQMIGSAAQQAAGPVTLLASGLKLFTSTPLGPAAIGAAAGIFVAVKAVSALSGGMAILNTVTKASPWMIALTGAAALTGVIIGLNAALGSGENAEQRLAGATNAAAAAHRSAASAAQEQKAALDALKGANLDVKDAELNLRDAQAAQRQAAAAAGPANTRTAAEKTAVARANIAAARAGLQYTAAVKAQNTAQSGAAAATAKNAEATRQDIFLAKQRLDAAQKEYGLKKTLSGLGGGGDAAAAAAKAKLTSAERAYADVLVKAPARYTAQANAARAAAGSIKGHSAAANASRAALLDQARKLDVSAVAARNAASATHSAAGGANDVGAAAGAAAPKVSALADAIRNLPAHKQVSITVSVATTSFLAGINHVAGLPPKKKARGGRITGPSGRDVIPAMLTANEWVLTADAADRLGGPRVMEAALSGKVPGFASGKTGGSSSPKRAMTAEEKKRAADEEERRRKARDAKYARIVSRPSDRFALGSARRDTRLARAENTPNRIGDDIRAINAQTTANDRRVTQITQTLKKNSKFLTRQEKAQLEAEKANLIRDSASGRQRIADLRSNRAGATAAKGKLKLDLQSARAGLTSSSADDLAALQAQQADAQGRIAAAKASGNKQDEIDAINDLRAASDGIRAWLDDAAAARVQAQDASIALAKLTKGTEDDRAALQAAKDDAQAQLEKAKAAGDNAAIVQLVERILGLTDSIDGLTTATDENTKATQNFGGSTTFDYRGQDYTLGSLMPSSDRLVGAEVGL